jgi:ribosomal protein L37AE/L43A
MEISNETVLIILLIVLVIFIGGFLVARYGNNKSFEVALTPDQIKDYFLKKHNCKDCSTKLKRIPKDEFLGEGWSSFMGTYSYKKNFRRTYFLKCPNCQKTFTSDDY